MGRSVLRLADLDVVVLDCQATGATPAHGVLLELGWAVARPGDAQPDVRSHWVAVPEGHRVPRIIRELTGFRDACHAEAIEPAAAWEALRNEAAPVADGSGRTPTVIHFARFELAFLRDLQARFGPEGSFPFDVVCLHEISRRLYPELPRLGLRALAGFLGHGTDHLRRSAGHVEASAFVWKAFAVELERRGVLTWDDLAGWSAERAPPRGRSYPLARERRRALPPGPGVYRFLRSNGDVLYVGKAASVRKRVASHFTNGARSGERALEMLTQARDVDVTPTASVLEAALLETDEIKRLDPPYNVQLREGGRAAWFGSRDFEHATTAPDDEHPIGPVPSRLSLSPYGALRALVAGAEPTELLRARAVGVPLAFAPGAEVFGLGWSAFAARHLDRVRSRTAEGKLAKASKAIFELARADLLDEGEDAPPGWDEPRVVRHLERAAMQGGQLLRRARWLCILSNAAIAFREAGASGERILRLEGADIVDQRDLGDAEPLPTVAPAGPWRARQAAFDAVRYDRLRVLTTELRRVLAEGGHARARVAGGRVLGATALARLLRWV